MTRIQLAGQGTPIPILALPDPNLSGDRPTIELILEDGIPFDKADYVNLGYTHYEVWCVGASGGLGGNAADAAFQWPITVVYEVMPPAVYTAWVEMLVYVTGDKSQFATKGRYVPYPPGPGDPMPPPAWQSIAEMNGSWYQQTGWWTLYEWAAHVNPSGIYPVRNYGTPVLVDSGNNIGGGGGGGGVHVVSGLLDELPDSTSVVVGVAGADAPPGQRSAPGVLTPLPNDPPLRPYNEMGSSVNPTWGPIFIPWANRYPDPHASFSSPGTGESGGESSFGDLAIASGGKGGNGAMKWVGSTLTVDAIGGAGGLGGQSDPGGGGLGSLSQTETGKDGTWDGTIGSGGGGGHGGIFRPTSGGLHGSPSNITPATDGGLGTFNYGDTSVYGQRQTKQNWMSGTVSHGAIIPGGGGGVRANQKRLVGSDAAGYSPHGMVLLRLMKID